MDPLSGYVVDVQKTETTDFSGIIVHVNPILSSNRFASCRVKGLSAIVWDFMRRFVTRKH